MEQYEIKKYISTGGIVPFTDKNESKDFEQYTKSLLQIDKKLGTTKLINMLRDPKTTMNIARLLYMNEKGELTNIERKVTKGVMQKLDIFGGKAGGQDQQNERKVVDTSKPHETPY